MGRLLQDIITIGLMAVTLTLGFAEGSQKPNIIFIVADDLGWNDVGFHNPDIISPNIDMLAHQGLILNHSYVQPLCSPSRSAFMTGFYPFTMGLQHLVIGFEQQVCLPLNKTFLPQVLKKNGYSTHMIGKWHLGFCKWECTPTYRGFDTFYGFYNGGEDHYSKQVNNGYDFRLNKTVDTEDKGGYSAFQFGARAVTLIREHDTSNPLFIYLPFQSVHMPLQVPENYTDLYPNIKNKNRKTLSGMVTAMDEAIGHVITALKDKGMYNNTLIAFTADNGGWTTFGGNNYPLRGGKVTIFEGGTRGAGFVHGPMLAKKGAVYDGMMHAVDWFPTLMEAAGISYSDPNQDGVSQWGSMNTLGASKRTEFIYNLDLDQVPVEGRAAIRVGDYKLIDGYPGLYQGWYKPADLHQGLDEDEYNDVLRSAGNMSAKSAEAMFRPNEIYKYLFNLKDDPEERHNLYNVRPDVVRQLEGRMAAYQKKYVKANYPPNDPDANPDNFGGNWSPGWC